MAQHDYNIANDSGAAVRADINSALSAIASTNSGSSSPGTTFAFQFWADTNENKLKLRNSANTDWIVLRELDGTLLVEDGAVGTPAIAFADDLNTGIYSPGADQLGITTAGVERVEFGTAEVVFNDGGAAYDFRVEGNTNTSLFMVDASADAVGIGTNAPGTLLELDGSAPYITLKNNTEEDTDGGRESKLIFEGEQSGGEISTLAEIQASHDGTADDTKGDLIFKTNNGTSATEVMRIDSLGRTDVQSAKSDVVTLTDASTVTPDFAAGNFFSLTFTSAVGNTRTLANPSNLVAGQSGTIFLVQDATGSRTIQYGSHWEFAGSAATNAPTLTTTGNAVDRIDYIVRSTTSIHAVATLNYS